MPQTTGLPAGPTSTHRTQTTNTNCKRNAPGAPPRREGACCRLSGTSLSAPRSGRWLPAPGWWLSAPGCWLSTPRGAACLPSGCWLSAPRSAGCRPQGAGCRPQGAGCRPRVLFVLHERPLSPSRCHLPLFPSTKMPILCSKCPKTGVPKGKSAQKPRFCARNARK